MSYAETLWAEALFCSLLQQSDKPSPADVRAAVHEQLHNAGHARCADRMAAEFGEHPDLSAQRMRWCLEAVVDAFRYAPA